LPIAVARARSADGMGAVTASLFISCPRSDLSPKNSVSFELDQYALRADETPCSSRNMPPEYSTEIEGHAMNQPTTERSFILVFRLLMAWTFLYAASHQGMFNPNFSAVGFLSHTKTFHDVYAVIATPAMDPVLTFLVSYGHLLIGLSLLFGLMVRVSAAFAVLLLLMYWTAHMEWPFIENRNNFIIDYHIVYAVVCIYLIKMRAGHVWGLDAWAEKLSFVQQNASLRPLVA
jgi:thiosulfate dehydrogenase (quinone) large subunit